MLLRRDDHDLNFTRASAVLSTFAKHKKIKKNREAAEIIQLENVSIDIVENGSEILEVNSE